MLRNQETHITLKMKVWDSYILPRITYGTKAMTLTSEYATKLKTTEQVMGKSMVGISLSGHIRPPQEIRFLQRSIIRHHEEDFKTKMGY